MALSQIGALWVAKPGSKAKLTGKITIEKTEYPVFVFPNEKAEGKQPPYRLAIDWEQGKDVADWKKGRRDQAQGPQMTDDDNVPFVLLLLALVLRFFA